MTTIIFMATMTNLSSVFVPFVGLVFPVIAMTSLFLHVEKTRIF